MPAIEYKSLWLPAEGSEMESTLNRLGVDGWTLEFFVPEVSFGQVEREGYRCLLTLDHGPTEDENTRMEDQMNGMLSRMLGQAQQQMQQLLDGKPQGGYAPRSDAPQRP